MNEKGLKKNVFVLIVLFIVAFLAGFLQSTSFEFTIYIFYFILLLGGVKLIISGLHSKIAQHQKIALTITGISLFPYYSFFLIAVITNGLFSTGITEMMEFFEGLFYLTSIIFLLSATTSIILLSRKRGSRKYASSI